MISRPPFVGPGLLPFLRLGLYPNPKTLSPIPVFQLVISRVPSVISLMEAPGLTMG